VIPAVALLTACGPLGDLGASSEADAQEARADAVRALERDELVQVSGELVALPSSS
jgi:hypothetical protein